MVRSLRGFPLLDGVRGRPRADVPALARALSALSAFAASAGPRLLSVDVNPVLVLPEGQGCYAADAVIEDAADAALDALAESGGGPVWDAEAFAALGEHVRGNLRPTTLEALAALRRRTADNAVQQRRLDTLDRILPRRLRGLAHTVALAQAGAHAQALAIVRTRAGQAETDTIRAVLDHFATDERRLMQTRMAEREQLLPQSHVVRRRPDATGFDLAE